MDEIELPSAFIKQDIKTDPITEEQLDELYNLSGSYEALFSKRARLYRERGLNNEPIDEDKYAELILEHYTFLKRPVIVNNSFCKRVIDAVDRAGTGCCCKCKHTFIHNGLRVYCSFCGFNGFFTVAYKNLVVIYNYRSFEKGIMF